VPVPGGIEADLWLPANRTGGGVIGGRARLPLAAPLLQRPPSGSRRARTSGGMFGTGSARFSDARSGYLLNHYLKPQACQPGARYPARWLAKRLPALLGLSSSRSLRSRHVLLPEWVVLASGRSLTDRLELGRDLGIRCAPDGSPEDMVCAGRVTHGRARDALSLGREPTRALTSHSVVRSQAVARPVSSGHTAAAAQAAITARAQQCWEDDLVLLVILGAGASFDSVDVDRAIPFGMRNMEFQPPLAQDLFDNRMPFISVLNRYPECRGLVVQLRRAVAEGRPLERELDLIASLGENDAVIASQLLAVRYYLREVIAECAEQWHKQSAGATNYHWLVGRLARWCRETDERVLYVTFNYDTMLERAIEDELRTPLVSLEDFIRHESLRVVKLHGSISWGHPVKIPGPWPLPQRSMLIRDPVSYAPTPEFLVRKDWNVGNQGDDTVPALAVPIERKQLFECPDEHIAAMRSALEDADRVLVIGWRATELPFIELLGDFWKRVRASMIVCGSAEAAEETSTHLYGRMFITNAPLYHGSLGFSDLPGHPTFDEFLSAEG
jgi:hypothetical protein